MKALLTDPTFGVLAAFVFFCMLVLKRAFRALHTQIERQQKAVRDEIKEADMMLEAAQKALKEATVKGDENNTVIAAINNTTDKQIAHIKAQSKLQVERLKKKSMALRERLLASHQDNLEKQLLEQGANILIAEITQVLAKKPVATSLRAEDVQRLLAQPAALSK